MLLWLGSSAFGCEGGCTCTGEDVEEQAEEESAAEGPSTDELVQEALRLAQENQAGADDTPAESLGGPLAGPEDQVEGEISEGQPMEEPVDDGFDPAALVPVEEGEGDDFATGLRILCVLTERVLEQHGPDGDPGRLAHLLQAGLRPHPSFAVIDEVMSNMSANDPNDLYPQIQAVARERGVPDYECAALQEVFRRFASAGPGQ